MNPSWDTDSLSARYFRWNTFATLHTTARHWILSRATLYTLTLYMITINFNITLPSIPWSFNRYLPFGFYTIHFLSISYRHNACYMPHTTLSHSVLTEVPTAAMNITCAVRTAVRHTSSHRTHVHTANVMLPHHHIDFYIFSKF